MTLERSLPLERLLAQADWVTALARALVADPATADDVAQAAWADVLQSRPETVENPRAWLAAIVRRKAQRVLRGLGRRARRERAVARERAAELAPSAAELATRVALHRELVDEVLALDEPYRETIVLRFFEHLDLATIGARMQCKHNTVRSRLQRGLDLLRTRLDRTHGGRERWLGAVAALGQRALELEVGSGTVAGGIAIALLMKKLALPAVALAAGLLLTLPLLGPAEPPLAPAAPAAPIASAALPAPASPAPATALPPATVAAGDRAAMLPASAPVPPPSPRSERRVVDRAGKPLANVRMRVASPAAVRWQGGDRGWIRGSSRTLLVDAAQEERLLRDPAFADQFFATLPAPEEWRATILGTPLPEREATSDDRGVFVFAPELAPTDAAIEVADPSRVLVVTGAGSHRPWIVGAAARVDGSVTDVDGKPIAGAYVSARFGDDTTQALLPGQDRTRSDAHGAFLVRRALAGGVVHVAADGFEPALVPVGTEPRQRLDVVLSRVNELAPTRVGGTVVTGGGRPVAGATVWLGSRQTKTGEDGRFALAVAELRPRHALTVLARGFAPLQLDELGAKIAAGEARAHDLLLVLDEVPLQLRGIVFDGDGRPLANALVNLADPMLLDVSFESVEARVGGWSGSVRTAADGTFTLGGLGARSYRVRAFDPATGVAVISPPARAGGRVLLRLPRDVRPVSGRVLAEGRPLGGATVEIACITHVTKGGGTQLESTPAVACDHDGRFGLPALPSRGVWLCVRVAGSVRAMVPVETLTGDRLVVHCDGARWLQLVGSEHPRARSIHFVLGGEVIAATHANRPAVLAPDGTAPVLALPDGVTVVVLDAGGSDERRLELTDDHAVHLRVR